MFVRLTYIDFSPEHSDTIKRMFNDEIIPVVKAQKGNIGIWFLEPTDSADEYISLTEWETRADADAYESSGVYRELVDKLKGMYKSKPVLKTYNVSDTKVTTAL